jgi:hypothetical protein
MVHFSSQTGLSLPFNIDNLLIPQSENAFFLFFVAIKKLFLHLILKDFLSPNKISMQKVRIFIKRVTKPFQLLFKSNNI